MPISFPFRGPSSSPVSGSNPVPVKKKKVIGSGLSLVEEGLSDFLLVFTDVDDIEYLITFTDVDATDYLAIGNI